MKEVKVVRVRPSQILVILFALVVGWASGHLGSIRYREDIREQIIAEISLDEFEADVKRRKDPLSFNKVIEFRDDFNSDGKYDSWMTIMRIYTPFEATYLVEDKNFDGEPDIFSLSTADLRMLYGLRSFPDNPEPNYQMFILSDVRGSIRGQSYSHFDINLDGRIDVVEIAGDEPERRIVLDDTWYPTSEMSEGNWFEGYTLEVDGKTAINVRFDWATGFWMQTNLSASGLN